MNQDITDITDISKDVVVKVKMVSPETHWFLMKRPDGTRYKTIYQKNQDPVSYDVHKLYSGWTERSVVKP